MKKPFKSLMIAVAGVCCQSQAATKVEWDAVFADSTTVIRDAALDGQGGYWLTGGKVMAHVAADGAMLWQKPAQDSLVFAGPYQSGMAVIQQTQRADYEFDRKLLLYDASGAIVATRNLDAGAPFKPLNSPASLGALMIEKDWMWGQWHADGSLVMVHRDTVPPYALSASSYSIGNLKSWTVPLGNQEVEIPTFVQNSGQDGAWILQIEWATGLKSYIVKARWISADGLPGPEQEFTVERNDIESLGGPFLTFRGAVPLGGQRLALAYSIDGYNIVGNPPDEIHVRILDGNGGPSATGMTSLPPGSYDAMLRVRDSSLEVVYRSTQGFINAMFESSLFFNRATGAFLNESPRRWEPVFIGPGSDFEGYFTLARDIHDIWLYVGLAKRIIEKQGDPVSKIIYPVILSGGTNQGATLTPQLLEAYPDTMCLQCPGTLGAPEAVGFLATADGGGLLYGHYGKSGKKNVSVGAIKVSPGFELPVRPRPLVRKAKTSGTSQVDFLGRVPAPGRKSHRVLLRTP
jgi:hypothetical protein